MRFAKSLAIAALAAPTLALAQPAHYVREAPLARADLRRPNSSDVVAVAAHNACAAEHNRRVDAHNLRVVDQNTEAARLNRDQADMSATCGTRTYYPRDRDAIIVERSVVVR